MEFVSASGPLLRKFSCLAAAIAVLAASGCSSVAPSRTASGAGVGAVAGGLGGAVIGSNSSLGTGTGAALGAVGGAITGGIIGLVQDAKDRKEQDRLAQERAYQQELAKTRSADAKRKAEADEEIAIAQGFRISDIELNEAQRQQEVAAARLKKLRDEKAGALAKKKALDDAHDKTLQTEAEIARLEEELTRLKGDTSSSKPAPTDAKSDTATSGSATPSTSAAAKPGI